MAEYDFTKAKDGDIFYTTLDKTIGVEKFVVRESNHYDNGILSWDDNVFYINSFLTHSSMIWEKGVIPPIPLFTNRVDAENYNRSKDKEYLEQLQLKYSALNDIIKLLYESALSILSEDYVLCEFIDSKLKEFNMNVEDI